MNKSRSVLIADLSSQKHPDPERAVALRRGALAVCSALCSENANAGCLDVLLWACVSLS